MKSPKALVRRLSSLTLAVVAIPGPAVYAYPGLGPSAGPGASSAPTSAPAPVAGPDAVVDPGGPMVGDAAGGWVPADPGSALVRSAATFAVGRLGEEFAGDYVVEDIHSAATQIVAGTNVLLHMRIARVDDAILGARKECGAVVYVPLGERRQDELASFTCQTVSPLAASTFKAPM